MAWLESVRLDVIPIWLLVWVGWLLVTGSIGELWRVVLNPRSPALLRLVMPLLIVGLAVGATFVSILALRPLGQLMGFGKATDYWMLVVLFLAPFDIWPVPWGDSLTSSSRRSLINVGLKLSLPVVITLIGFCCLWVYAWASNGLHLLLLRMRLGTLATWFHDWLVLNKEFDADQFTFDQPWLLLLLIGIPVLFVISYRSLAALGKYRRVFALGYRGRVLLLMILALAGVQLQKISERMTVMYLLDQSESIPKAVREAMLEYVMKDVAQHRHKGDLTTAAEDKAGVIVFGREATIEHPPFADDIRSVGKVESDLRVDATNIASALKLAQAAFPEDSAKRIVIVTDGNENLGDARAIASGLADNGIGIDVVAVRLTARNEVAVEKIGLPSDIRRGQPLEARVVVNNYGESNVSGRLRIVQNFNGLDNLLSEQAVTLKPGKNVYSVQHTIDVPAGYTYSARFIPNPDSGDAMEQNNAATAFTHVRGKGRILMIVDAENPREFDGLIARLGELNMEVDRMPSDNLFASLAQLQGYDCVVLANVARSSSGGDDAVSFTDDQISMLVRNTEQFGCGLVMIGGPNSFGAGAWANTELEKAMPVDFQIKNSKVKAVGALVLLMHACEIPDGNNIQKKVAEQSVDLLGPMDYCGLLQWENFTGGDNWLWRDPTSGKGLVRVGDQKKSMTRRISKMAPGDMPDFDPAMTKAIKEFEVNPASVKHMIVISDGDPSPPSPSIISRFQRASVTISTVAIGSHGPAESGLLQRIANQTGGKYYAVNNPKAIPKIFQREARRVARPLILEERFQPYVLPEAKGHEMLQNIDGPLPELSGFVMTTVKENPLVEVLIRSPKPGEDSNSTILAAWTYGAGKTCIFTSDAGQRWANDWTEWENYNKFYSQMIRWAMRPVNEEGKFTVATDVKDGKVRVVVTALKENDEFLNFLNMSGVGADPELKNIQLNMVQEAPGRYVGEFDADKAGSYLMAINTGMGGAPLLTGITVPYSAEYRERESNEAILTSLASYIPKGGLKGEMIEGPLAKDDVAQLVKDHDSFRRTLQKANSSQDIWPLFLMVAGVLFLADVFVRRVQVNFAWVIPAVMWTWHRLLRREIAEAADERMERLRNLKATVSNQLDERRAAARFEPQVDVDTPARDPGEVLGEAAAAGPAQAPPPPRASGPLPQTEEESYTERLLAAKKKMRKDPPS